MHLNSIFCVTKVKFTFSECKFSVVLRSPILFVGHDVGNLFGFEGILLRCIGHLEDLSRCVRFG